MKFTRMTRTDIVGQLKLLQKAAADSDKTRVIVLRPCGEVQSVVKIEDGPSGVFLWTYREGAPELGFARLFGSRIAPFDLDALVSALDSCATETVWLQAPSSRPRTVVGACMGVKTGDTFNVALAPVPFDIDDVNREIKEFVSAVCPAAAIGLSCDECERADGCEDYKKALAESKRKRGAVHDG